MQPPHSIIVPKIPAGNGRISLTSYGSNAILSELASTYPLKLVSPRTVRHNVAVVYFLTYGGGLVGGDEIDISIHVDSQTVLVLRSQGSTKVFKSRPERLASAARRPPPTANASSIHGLRMTMQTMTTIIATEGSLFLLPDPVTCFRSASYSQKQTFHLSGNSSLLVLDWLTSGRISMGEEWAFSRYHSVNDVWIDERRIAKDIMLLDNVQDDKGAGGSMGDRLAPYSCYAMVILYGPLVQNVIRDLASRYDNISVFEMKSPAEMIWSLSPMALGKGAIVRVAGKETERVKKWLGEALVGIEERIGMDVYRNTFL